MSDKCEYCKKDLTFLNAENKSRHNLKHLNSGHTKITSIKPITGYFHKQAATTNLASLIEQNHPFANLDETITIDNLNENLSVDKAIDINSSFDKLANVLEINDLIYKPEVSYKTLK